MKQPANQVRISYSPITDIIVHEFVPVDMQDLLRARITPQGNFPLLWCGGFLYTFNSLPWTKDVVKDYLAGKVHWSEVQYTKMDKYKEVIDLIDENYKAAGPQKIRVIDTSKSKVHQEFTRWLKEST